MLALGLPAARPRPLDGGPGVEGGVGAHEVQPFLGRQRAWESALHEVRTEELGRRLDSAMETLQLALIHMRQDVKLRDSDILLINRIQARQ